MRTFDDVFAAFGGPAALAKEIGIRPFHAQTMKARNSIPSGYWPDIMRAACRLGITGVTLEVLAAIAAAKVGRDPGTSSSSERTAS